MTLVMKDAVEDRLLSFCGKTATKGQLFTLLVIQNKMTPKSADIAK